jgi:phosphatidylinositol alpha-mannosyltransferase
VTIAVEATSLRIGLLYDDSLDHHGGVTQYVMMLARALRGAGHEVCLLVGESSVDVGDGCPVHALAHNMPVRFNGSTHSMPVFSRAHRIQRLLETHAFDVIHVQVPYSPLLSGRVISRLSARTALIGTFHVASERTLPRVGARALSALTWRTLKRFDKILSVSKCAARFAADTYGLESTLVIPTWSTLRTSPVADVLSVPRPAVRRSCFSERSSRARDQII